MEPGSDHELHYEPLPPGKRGLLIALLYHLKERYGLELQDIAAPARSVSINDYCRRSAPKAEPAIFRGVYRTVRARPEALAPWASAAFATLYGEEPEAAPPDMGALLAQLFPHAIRDPEALERTAAAHCGVYALYHYRASGPHKLNHPGIDERFEFERARLEIFWSEELPNLRFRLFHHVESYGRYLYDVQELSGFVIPTPANLYLIGSEQQFPHHGMLILPHNLQQVPSVMGMMMIRQKGHGFFASRILTFRAKNGEEDTADTFRPGFDMVEDLPGGVFSPVTAQATAQRLRNIVPFDGRSGLIFPE